MTNNFSKKRWQNLAGILVENSNEKYIKPDDSPESHEPSREDFEEWLAQYKTEQEKEGQEKEGEEKIKSESTLRRAEHDFLSATVDSHVAALLKDLEIDQEDIVVVYDELTNLIKKFLSNVAINESLSERSTPEAGQDIAAYFGSNDSVDGPYKKVSKLQPFEDDKHRKKFLKKIHAESALKEEKYPETATEYAEQLNNKSSSAFKLVEDPKHWEEIGVHTGEDLARYLAVEEHINAYKEWHGIKPRHIDYDQYSIEDIKKMTDDLYTNIKLYDEDPPTDYEEEEYQAQKEREYEEDRDPRDEWDKEYDKYEKFELDFD